MVAALPWRAGRDEGARAVPSLQPAFGCQLGVGGSYHSAAHPQRYRQGAAGRQSLAGTEQPVSDARPQLADDLAGQRDITPAISGQREFDGDAHELVLSDSFKVAI
jgi:hypothetical protein